MSCLLGQLCWTGRQTFLSSSIHLQWQAAQVAGRSAIVIFPEAIGVGSVGAGKRSEPNAAKQD